MMVVDSESDARGTSDENALPPEQAEHEIEPPIQFSGVTVFNGVALGQAQILSEGELEVPHFSIDKPQTRAEFTRLRAAISRVSKELDELANNASFSDAMTEALAFVDLHRQILNDESLISETQNIIRERLINAEWALAIRLEEIRKAFEAIDDEYLAERVEDIAQVIERIQRELSGRRRPADTLSRTMSEGKIILIARDLNPTDILILKRRRDVSIAGLITETGSQTSHTAILARSLEIPSLVSVPGVTEHIQNDDVVLLDADKGILIAHPDSTSLPTVATRIRELTATKNRQRRLRNKKNVSLDGQPFELLANIALPEDVLDAVHVQANGVGLFRSEFLFMNRPSLPSEDEQYETYLRVIRAMKGKPVTIRTMDLGGDKLPSDEALESMGASTEPAPNPALGLRAIRFSMAHSRVFIDQLKAILRAAVDADVRILLPMLTRTTEIDITRTYIAQAQQELKEKGVPYAEHIRIGGMIEVPAAALMISAFLKKLDFVSIGTNDLVQYTLAVDRHDPEVSELYDPMHPAVLSLLYKTIQTAIRAKKEVCVCGEIAGDPVMARLLLGMGLRSFSMESGRILPIKEALLNVDASKAKALVARVHRMTNLQHIHDVVSATPCN